MKNHSLLLSMAMLTLIAISLPSPAAAKDAVTAAVSNITPDLAIPLRVNGTELSQGTFGIGTIQLFFTVNDYQFPCGQDFGSFSLELGIKDGPTTGTQTKYPVAVDLKQTGSQNLVLTPATASFTVDSAHTWSPSDTTTVTIYIPCGVSNEDGTDLVGNLQIVAPGGSHLDTPTTVQVHVLLVHPTDCLRVFHFLTDEAFTTIVTSTVVSVGGPRNNPKIVSTTPFGQFSDNTLIVNACSTAQVFDLDISLDECFETNPNGNPGNAVFTFLTSGAIDPTTFDITALGTGTGHGQNLWLDNITVPAGDSFLATVHITLIKGGSPSTLPTDGIFDGFLTQLLDPSSDPTSFTPVILFPMAEPNPAAAEMTFTVQ